MNLSVLTGLIGIPLALLGGTCIPIYLNRRTEKRIAVRDAARERADDAAGAEVSLEALNRALFEERNTLKLDLATQTTAHAAEIATMRQAHAQEIADLKRGHDDEMSTLSARLTECQDKVQKLYRELYELQKLLPPRP